MSALTPRTGRVGDGEWTAYDQGAHLASWRVRGRPVIWVSRLAQYGPGSAIRGGIPVCWPWFAPGRSGDLSPMHGFARLAGWTLTEHQEGRDLARLQWRLTGADVAGVPGAQHFPHPFEAWCTLTVGGERLGVELRVRNCGASPFDYEGALHSYLHVGDVRRVRVSGLDGADYWDKVLRRPGTQQGDLVLEGETDRIYHSSGPVQLHDPTLRRTLVVESQACADTVVWSPGEDKARELSDFAADEWDQMLCVEAANVGDHAVALAPGAEHTMGTTISIG